MKPKTFLYGNDTNFRRRYAHTYRAVVLNEMYVCEINIYIIIVVEMNVCRVRRKQI